MKRNRISNSFLAVVMLLAAFLTKLVSEVIHEILGHGPFVLLFGGRVTSFRISLLWPYELSHIGWSVPVLEGWQMAWLYGGGILATSLTLFLTQALLRATKPSWEISITLNWLSFWCLMNAAGYLVIGGIYPFGDVAELIALSAISSQLSIVLGIILIALGFFLISQSVTSAVRPLIGSWAPLASIVMWSVVPLVVWLAMAGLGIFSHLILIAGLVPPVLSVVMSILMIKQNEL